MSTRRIDWDALDSRWKDWFHRNRQKKERERRRPAYEKRQFGGAIWREDGRSRYARAAFCNLFTSKADVAAFALNKGVGKML